VDWEIGDLALCVKVGPWHGNRSRRVVDGPAGGQTYKVSWVGLTSSGLGLELEGVETHRNKDGSAILWRADKFRKIRPDEHEPCEAEFVTLLKLSKQRVSA